jgi:hypothetical protein
MTTKYIYKGHATLELTLTQTHTKCPLHFSRRLYLSRRVITLPKHTPGTRSEALQNNETMVWYLLRAELLDWDGLTAEIICVTFHPEDGGSNFLRNVHNCL